MDNYQGCQQNSFVQARKDKLAVMSVLLKQMPSNGLSDSINQRHGRINGLILAAGLSSRMGEQKMLMPLRGKTVIENTIDSMLLAGVEQIVIVLGYRGQELEELLARRYTGQRFIVVYNQRYAETDMLASLKIGLAAMPECRAFFLLPGDMPMIDKETYLAIFQAMPQTGRSITFPLLHGYRKHPPLIDSSFIEEILNFDGQDGLRGFWNLNKNYIYTIDVDDLGCWTDLDTREQYRHCLNKVLNEKNATDKGGD